MVAMAEEGGEDEQHVVEMETFRQAWEILVSIRLSEPIRMMHLHLTVSECDPAMCDAA